MVSSLIKLGELPLDFSVVPLLPNEEGVGVGKQLMTKSRVDVVVGTPQLLANLIRLRLLRTSCVQAVVLDEIDTLLDDSFINASVSVLANVKLRGVDASRKVDSKEEWMRSVAGAIDIPPSFDGSANTVVEKDEENDDPFGAVVDHAQLALVGATLPVHFQRSLQQVVDTDSLHRVTTPHLHRIAQHIHHKFIRVKPSLKPEYFLQTLNDSWVKKKHPPTMIFCNRNATIHFLKSYLEREGFGGSFEVLSKDVDDEKRLATLKRFHEGFVSLLLCSDLASRGVDTSKAVNVINYEFPNSTRLESTKF